MSKASRTFLCGECKCLVDAAVVAESLPFIVVPYALLVVDGGSS